MSISWNETVPSGTSQVKDFPDYARSVYRNIESGLSGTVFWPGQGGGSDASIGELKPGASRTYFAAQSASSNADNGTLGGRLFLASDVSRLFVYTSNGTYLVGTPFLVEAPSSAGWIADNTHVVMQSGTTFVPGNQTSHTIPFPSSYTVNGKGVAPQVFLTVSALSLSYGVSSVTAGGFVSVYSYTTNGGTSSFTIHWESLGTVAAQL